MDEIVRYKVGDRVWLYCPQGRHANATRKFNWYWRGPYIVLEKLSDLNYKVKAEGAKRSDVVNVDRMLPFRTREEVIGVPLLQEDVRRTINSTWCLTDVHRRW